MTTVAWPESWLYGNEVQGLQALLCMCVTSPSLYLSVCVCVCVRHSWLESRCADCQSVESGRTYCQQLLSSADSSIYEYIYIYI